MSTLRKIKKFFSVKEVPLQDKSVDVFKTIIEEMPWQEVLAFKEKFVPREGDPWEWHDRELSSLLRKRLFRLELPVFYFGEEDKKQVLWVNQNASSRAIKDLVAREMTSEDSPKFVVEECGKVRGFALSPTLIVVGCALVYAAPEKIIEQAKMLGVFLPTKEDASLIGQNQAKLNYMMQKVGVPSLAKVSSFLLASDTKNSWDFPIWILSCARNSSIEWDDMTFLLAKM